MGAGVDRNKISIDPGIGKWVPERTAAYDLAILDGFDRLRIIGRPVMAALSRKTFIGESLNIPDPGQRLAGTPGRDGSSGLSGSSYRSDT